MVELDKLGIDSFPDKVMLDITILGTIMMLGVFCKCHYTIIVNHDMLWFWSLCLLWLSRMIADFTIQAAQPYSLFAGFSDSHILSFSTR